MLTAAVVLLFLQLGSGKTMVFVPSGDDEIRDGSKNDWMMGESDNLS